MKDITQKIIEERTGAIPFKKFDQVVFDFLDDLQSTNEDDILKFGLEPADEIFGGIFPTDIIVVGADTGCGKSEFALSVAHHNSSVGKKVALFDLENDEFESARRRLYVEMRKIQRDESISCNFTMLDLKVNTMLEENLVFADLLERAANNLTKIGENLLVYSSDKLPTLTEFLEHFESIKDVDLIVIDHVHYFGMEGGQNYSEEIGKIVRALRTLAKERRVPIVLVSHLRRRANKKDDPTEDDFYGSSHIAKECTGAMIFTKMEELPYNTKMIIAKNRGLNNYTTTHLKFCDELKQFISWQYEDKTKPKDSAISRLSFNKTTEPKKYVQKQMY